MYLPFDLAVISTRTWFLMWYTNKIGGGTYQWPVTYHPPLHTLTHSQVRLPVEWNMKAVPKTVMTKCRPLPFPLSHMLTRWLPWTTKGTAPLMPSWTKLSATKIICTHVQTIILLLYTTVCMYVCIGYYSCTRDVLHGNTTRVERRLELYSRGHDVITYRWLHSEDQPNGPIRLQNSAPSKYWMASRALSRPLLNKRVPVQNSH